MKKVEDIANKVLATSKARGKLGESIDAKSEIIKQLSEVAHKLAEIGTSAFLWVDELPSGETGGSEALKDIKEIRQNILAVSKKIREVK